MWLRNHHNVWVWPKDAKFGRGTKNSKREVGNEFFFLTTTPAEPKMVDPRRTW
jgi:hypothetical protein